MELNVENVRKVIETIRNEENFFNMFKWFIHEGSVKTYRDILDTDNIPSCGTASCIGGWASHLGKDDPEYEHAAHWLGLTPAMEDALFYPRMEGFNSSEWHDSDLWKEITRQQAIETLERLIETDTVRWPWQNKEIGRNSVNAWDDEE